MVDNSKIIQGYIKGLLYKLTAYTDVTSVEKYSTLDTSGKIAFIKELEGVLDKSHIFSKAFSIEDSSIMPIIKDIHAFLFEEDNYLYRHSYLKMLIRLKELQDMKVSKDRIDTYIAELGRLEGTFIMNISFRLRKIQELAKDAQIESKVNKMLNPSSKVFASSLATIIMATCLMAYSILPASAQTKNIQNITATHPNTSPTKFNMKDWLTKQNTDNMLVNAANFLQRADTCSAWAMIKSLEKLEAPINVECIYNNDSAGFAKNHEETVARFKKLCSQAVNYTLLRYAKTTDLKIKKYAKDLTIIFINNPSDTTKNLAWYDHEKEQITVNEARMNYSPGANALLLFALLGHETVHMLVAYNTNYEDIIATYAKEFNDNYSKGIKSDQAKVKRFIYLYGQYYRYTESQAYRFEQIIFDELFKGILSSDKNSFHIAESYQKMIQRMYQLNADESGEYREITAQIKKNLLEMSQKIWTLSAVINVIIQNKYDDLDKKIKYYEDVFLDKP
jgi:hypothetical protein